MTRRGLETYIRATVTGAVVCLGLTACATGPNLSPTAFAVPPTDLPVPTARVSDTSTIVPVVLSTRPVERTLIPTPAPDPTVLATQTLSLAQWREQFRKPVEVCPAGQAIEDMVPLQGKKARIAASSTGKIIERFLASRNFLTFFPTMADFSSRGIDGAMVPDVRAHLDELLDNRYDWNFLAFFVARNEADLPRRDPGMSKERMAQIETTAFHEFQGLVSDARVKVGQNAILMGITIFPPPDPDPKVRWIVDEFNVDMVANSGHPGGYVAVDLRACDVSFRDAIHVEDGVIGDDLLPGVRNVMVREALKQMRVPVYRMTVSPN